MTAADEATPAAITPLAGLRTKPAVDWQLRTGSDPLASPGQPSGTLFVDGSTDGTRPALWAFAAVAASDGAVKWSRKASFQLQGYASGGVLGVSGASLQLLDAGSGAVRWSAPFASGDVASALGDVVLVRPADTGTGVTVLSAADGKQLWTSGSGYWLAASPTSRTLYALDGKALQIVDAESGKVLESAQVGAVDPASEQIWAVNGARPVVLVRDPSRGSTAAFTRGSLTPIWHSTLTGEPVSLPDAPGLLISKSAGDTTETYARTDPATGKQVWSLEVEGPFTGGTTASSRAGRLQLHGQRADGSALVEGVDPATGELLWRKQIARTVNLSVAVSDDVVYVRHDDGSDVTHGQVDALDAASGRRLWEIAPSTLGLMTPTPVDHGPLVESSAGLRRLG